MILEGQMDKKTFFLKINLQLVSFVRLNISQRFPTPSKAYTAR